MGTRTYDSEIPNYGTWIGVLQLHNLIKRFEKMAAKVDIRDPYSSCQEAQKWDAMTVDSFIRQCVSYEASGLHCIISIAREVETLSGRSYWRR